MDQSQHYEVSLELPQPIVVTAGWPGLPPPDERMVAPKTNIDGSYI